MYRTDYRDVFLLVVPILWLVGLAVVTLAAYLAIRFGVRHGIRDAYRQPPPSVPFGPPPPAHSPPSSQGPGDPS